MDYPEPDMLTEECNDFNRSYFSDLDSQADSDDSFYTNRQQTADEQYRAITFEQHTAIVANIRYHMSQLPDLRAFYSHTDIFTDTRLVASRTPDSTHHLGSNPESPLLTNVIGL